MAWLALAQGYWLKSIQLALVCCIFVDFMEWWVSSHIFFGNKTIKAHKVQFSSTTLFVLFMCISLQYIYHGLLPCGPFSINHSKGSSYFLKEKRKEKRSLFYSIIYLSTPQQQIKSIKLYLVHCVSVCFFSIVLKRVLEKWNLHDK